MHQAIMAVEAVEAALIRLNCGFALNSTILRIIETGTASRREAPRRSNRRGPFIVFQWGYPMAQRIAHWMALLFVEGDRAAPGSDGILKETV